MGPGHEAEGQHDSQQDRRGQDLTHGEGQLEQDVGQESCRSQVSPDQAVDLFEKIHDDEQRHKGQQAQPRKLEKLPAHVVFQGGGAERQGRSHHFYIPEIPVGFIRLSRPPAGEMPEKRTKVTENKKKLTLL